MCGGTQMNTTTLPVAKANRIETLDVLRGVAICGILLMNIPFMGMLGDLGTPAFPFRWNADWTAWLAQSLFFEGTMRGLFTMLFGAGMLLMLRNAEKETPQVRPFDVWTRRCWALIALGVMQFVIFLWPGEILVNYGVAGLFLLAVRTAKPKILIGLAAAVLIASTIPDVVESVERTQALQISTSALADKAAHKKLTTEQSDAIKAREKALDTFHPKPADIAKEYEKRTHYPSVLKWSVGIWHEWNMGAQKWYLGGAESLGFMLIGMALFRTGVLTGEASFATYRWMMIIGYGLGFAARAIALYTRSRSGFDLDFNLLNVAASAYRAGIYEPARLAITIGHVGLLCTLFRAGALGRATPLRALGRMALTVYSLQSILTSILFYGMGKVGAFGFATLMGIAAVIWVVTGLFCVWWLSRFEMGPAEQMLRAVAYGTPLKLRRAPPAGGAADRGLAQFLRAFHDGAGGALDQIQQSVIGHEHRKRRRRGAAGTGDSFSKLAGR